jgi:hypothetical protein
MTATTTTRTDNNGPPHQTLASQLDRLDSILDGLNNALAGAVQAVVCTAVKEAVQAVLTEVLTNRELQEQLQQVVIHAAPADGTHSKQSTVNRPWQATTEGIQRTLQKVKQLGRGVGVALVAAGGVLAGIVYTARKKIACLASAVYGSGRPVLGKAITALASLMPSFAFGVT